MGHGWSLEMAAFDSSHTSSYSPSIITIWLYLVPFSKLSEILVEKTPIFHTPLIVNLHDPLEPVRIFAQYFNTNSPSP